MSDAPYQMPLGIGAAFTYRPEHFVEHGGVTQIIDYLEEQQAGVFRAAGIVGAARSGKTHLSFFCAERLAQRGFAPTLRVAPDLRRLENIGDGSVPALIIDDAQNLLIDEALVAPFVALYEQVRQASGLVILLSSRALQANEDNNPHIGSRLASLTQLEIGVPSREDVQSLLLAIAKQRGFKLKERKRQFLERRIGNDLASIEKYVERLLQLSNTTTGPIGFDILKDAI